MTESDYGFALEVQQLRRDADQILVLDELAGQLNRDGWFTPADVSAMFAQFRVPTPQNVSARLGELRRREHVVNRRRTASHPAGWSLTPSGHRHVLELIGQINAAELAPELAETPGAEFGHQHHTLLPPGLAPLGWREGINRLLSRSPFEKNVLCMTRFRREEVEDDPIDNVIAAVKNALEPHGLRLHLASDRIVDDDLWGNVAAYTWACKFGVGLIEDRVGEGVNQNVLIEVGAMHIAGRRCALLKDRTIKRMPTDLIGRIRKDVDFDDLTAVGDQIHDWAAEDLDLGRCSACPQ